MSCFVVQFQQNLLKDGGELHLPGYSHIACPLDNLICISEVIGVARGVEKKDAIYHVANGGYIKTLNCKICLSVI